MQSQSGPVTAPDIDIAALGRALWRAKGWIIALTLAAGVVTFVGLSMVRPLYTSEARILVVNDVSPFTRAESDQGRAQQQALDEQAVQSQVQVLTSRDLALEVAKDLNLADNPEFAKDAGVSLFKRLLNKIGLARGSEKSRLELAADAFSEHLAVYALNKSSVIAIDYTSGDSELAAQAANKLAEVYIGWQRKSKLEQTKDASSWLSSQIEELRKKVSESEAAVEQFRSSNGLYEGQNNVTLNAQQLSEVNSQLIMAKAQKSEAEARARLIKKMLDANGDIDATPEVLKSELIGRLIEQRVQVQRQLAELSATLLPSHPRIKQLNSELTDVRSQIRDEANKIVRGLENEAEVASARASSLQTSLNDVKSQASGQSDAEIKLRALEREAKANRDLLEAYLARYRDASARHDMDAVPADATIVSNAHASSTPSFPKRASMTLLVMVATALLSVAYVLARELIGGTATAGLAPVAVNEAPRRTRRFFKGPGSAEPATAPPRAEPEPSLPDAAALGEIYRGADPGRRPYRTGLSAMSSHQAKPQAFGQERDGGPEAAALAEPPQASFIDRIRRAQMAPPHESVGGTAGLRGGDRTAPVAGSEAAPNDLRRYFQHRAAAPIAKTANNVDQRSPANGGHSRAAAASGPENGPTGPVLKSLNAVLNHVLTRAGREAPGLLLVAEASPNLDTAEEAIEIGRLLAMAKRRTVLVDLSHGDWTISRPLGLPLAPGFTDLVAGQVGFEDVIRIDADTPLQLITSGNERIKVAGDKTARASRVFEALVQAYDCVVLHADDESLGKLGQALEGRLSTIIPVLPPGGAGNGRSARLTELGGRGCQILPYEQPSEEPRKQRARFFGRAAAI